MNSRIKKKTETSHSLWCTGGLQSSAREWKENEDKEDIRDDLWMHHAVPFSSLSLSPVSLACLSAYACNVQPFQPSHNLQLAGIDTETHQEKEREGKIVHLSESERGDGDAKLYLLLFFYGPSDHKDSSASSWCLVLIPRSVCLKGMGSSCFDCNM